MKKPTRNKESMQEQQKLTKKYTKEVAKTYTKENGRKVEMD